MPRHMNRFAALIILGLSLLLPLLPTTGQADAPPSTPAAAADPAMPPSPFFLQSFDAAKAERPFLTAPLPTDTVQADSPVPLDPVAGWFSTDSDETISIAWGDVDGDGDLDLAVGNGSQPANEVYLNGGGQPNKVYLNEGGVLQTTDAWRSADSEMTQSVAWGDVDGDGDLDLAAGNDYGADKVYLNEGGVLSPTAAWQSDDSDATWSVAWGDVDGDGDLDLATGNYGEPNKVYLNEGGGLSPTAAWQANDSDDTISVAWGDVDGDSDLDLAAGNCDEPNKVYLNVGGVLSPTATWQADDSDCTISVAWGDVDGDGDLDLAAGNVWEPNKVYLNVGGVLSPTAAWQTADSADTWSVAWGDVDGDGDLDLAVGNRSEVGQPNKLYLNVGGVLSPTASWLSADSDWTTSIAWGDVDSDGDLDLAAGNGGWVGGESNKVYLNVGGVLSPTAAWQSADSDGTHSVAWGDMDGDGDLDLAAGNDYGPNKVYLNVGGVLSPTAAWQSADDNDTHSIAWGDVDGDGDLDLAAGNNQGANKVYLNVGGVLSPTAVWQSADSDWTVSIAWGDVDSDGDLDLAAGNAWEPNKVYLNVGGILSPTAAWQSADSDPTYSIAWGDMDGDGDLDLAAGNDYGPNKVYLNVGGVLSPTAAWQSADSDPTKSIAWGDMDGDGDLDLATGSRVGARLDQTAGELGSVSSRVYLNVGGMLSPVSFWQSADFAYTWSIAWGDIDGDGDLDLATGNDTGANKVYLNGRPGGPTYAQPAAAAIHLDLAPAGGYALAQIRGPESVVITYTLFDPGGYPKNILALYSPDGGGRWLPVLPTSDTITTSLATSLYPTTTVTNTHVYTWSLLDSGFFGQSDNVVFRLLALPDPRSRPNGTAGPYQRPYVSAQTYPFRVRGSQVRVLSDTLPLVDAIVYCLPAGQSRGALPYSDLTGTLYRTNIQGYLQGRGELFPGDRLVALLPITYTDAYTVYHTSATPTAEGMDLYTVTAPGVQTLTVSPENVLVLFNLDVSLEWDARQDDQFLAQLTHDLERTAELLFDWSNGQAALSRVTVHHDRAHWNDADLRIYANNRLHPSAAQGGIVPQVISDTLVPTLTYAPGQVYIGPTWDRFGDPGGSLEDWPRVLAHELGRYAFFLDDNYLGLDNSGLLIPVAGCPGAMSDPYRVDWPYDEFHLVDDWLPACADTLSQQLTGRPDWSTIALYYPWLDDLTANPGPAGLPLAVAQVRFVEPLTPTTTLPDPLFSLTENGHTVQPGLGARALLYQANRVVDLGRPVLGQVLARGARVGDRLCIYEPEADRLGCETITEVDRELTLNQVVSWTPDLLIAPVTSRTLALTVTGVPAGLPLFARLYPADDPAPAAIPLTEAGGAYNGVFTTTEPAYAGYVQLWVDEPAPRREALIDYALGGNPARIKSRYARIKSRYAPAISNDGQVILFGRELDFQEEQYLALQAVNVLPSPPPWATSVGRAYRLLTSPGGPDLAGTSISFAYLGSEVPPGEEQWLRVYYWDEATWTVLTTTLNTDYNLASAPVQGPGLYALMSSIEIPLAQGWNMISYPVAETRPVDEALLSISGSYVAVYYYDPFDLANPWQVYAPGAPDWVNDLENLEFGRGYWLYASRPLTLRLRGAVGGRLALPDSIPTPPAIYYGPVLSGGGFTATVGLEVRAWIEAHPCGLTQTREEGGQVVYVIEVPADDGGSAAGCGVPGRLVTFSVGETDMTTIARWTNVGPRFRTLSAMPLRKIYLPLVLK